MKAHSDGSINTFSRDHPLVDKKKQCKLTCRAVGKSYYFTRDNVIDGTPCNEVSTDICVDGQCMVSWLPCSKMRRFPAIAPCACAVILPFYSKLGLTLIFIFIDIVVITTVITLRSSSMSSLLLLLSLSSSVRLACVCSCSCSCLCSCPCPCPCPCPWTLPLPLPSPLPLPLPLPLNCFRAESYIGVNIVSLQVATVSWDPTRNSTNVEFVKETIPLAWNQLEYLTNLSRLVRIS